MPLSLILTRHAKSSWDDPLASDHDRPLNKRGRRSAKALGQWLAEKNHVPAEVVSSTARRTVETWEGMAPALPDGTLIRRDPKLYHAEAETILSCLHACAGSPVMLIGHNPGISDFANRIVAEPSKHERFWDYPTGATLIAQFPMDDWTQVGFGTGEVVDFIVPRDLLPVE